MDTRAFTRAFFGEQDLVDPKMDIPITKEEGALQEHLCDVIGVACRHVMRKERHEIYSPF